MIDEWRFDDKQSEKAAQMLHLKKKKKICLTPNALEVTAQIRAVLISH